MPAFAQQKTAESAEFFLQVPPKQDEVKKNPLPTPIEVGLPTNTKIILNKLNQNGIDSEAMRLETTENVISLAGKVRNLNATVLNIRCTLSSKKRIVSQDQADFTFEELSLQEGENKIIFQLYHHWRLRRILIFAKTIKKWEKYVVYRVIVRLYWLVWLTSK